MIQLDMFAPPEPPPAVFVPRAYREVATRAYRDGPMRVADDECDPFEVEVRGVPCVISWSNGFSTHAINPPGSQFWSETGYRSFGHLTVDPEEVCGIITDYIARSEKAGGCGGKLRPWWPHYVLQWQQSLAFELSFGDRAEVWNQWGPETHEDCWHRHDMKLADAIEQMAVDGIDPNDVGKPSHFKGKWPKFASAAT